MLEIYCEGSFLWYEITGRLQCSSLGNTVRDFFQLQYRMTNHARMRHTILGRLIVYYCAYTTAIYPVNVVMVWYTHNKLTKFKWSSGLAVYTSLYHQLLRDTSDSLHDYITLTLRGFELPLSSKQRADTLHGLTELIAASASTCLTYTCWTHWFVWVISFEGPVPLTNATFIPTIISNRAPNCHKVNVNCPKIRCCFFTLSLKSMCVLNY